MAERRRRPIVMTVLAGLVLIGCDVKDAEFSEPTGSGGGRDAIVAVSPADTLDGTIRRLRIEGRYVEARELVSRARSNLSDDTPTWRRLELADLDETLGTIAALPDSIRADVVRAELTEDELWPGEYDAPEVLVARLARAAEVWREHLGSDHRELSRILCALGQALIARDRADLAVEPVSEALRIDEVAVHPEHPQHARTLRLYGALLNIERRFDAALPVLMRAREIFEAAGGHVIDLTTTCNELAVSYRWKGDVTTGAALLREAVRHFEENTGPSSPQTLAALHNVGMIYHLGGRRDDARDVVAEIMRRAESDTDEGRTAYINAVGLHAATLYYDVGADSAMAYATARLPVDEWHEYPVDVQLDLLLMRAGALRDTDPDGAVAVMQSRIELVEREQPGSLVSRIRLMRSLAQHCSNNHRIDLAIATLRDAARLARDSLDADHPVLIELLDGLSMMVAAIPPDYEACRAAAVEAVLHAERILRETSGDERWRARRAGRLRHDAMCRRAALSSYHLDDPAACFHYRERGRSRAFLDFLRAGAEAAGADSLQRRVRSRRQQLVQAESELMRLVDPDDGLDGSSDEAIARQRDRVTDLRAQLRAEEAELRGSSHAGEYEIASAISFDDLRAALEPGEVYLDYLWGGTIIVATLVTPESAQPITTASIRARDEMRVLRERLTRLRGQLERRPDPFAPGTMSSELSRALREAFDLALLPEIRDRAMAADRLILARDGVLRDIPFEALIPTESPVDTTVARPEEFWLFEGPDVVYVESATEFVHQRGRAGSKLDAAAGARDLVIVADPDFGRASAGEDLLASTVPSERAGLSEVELLSLDDIRLYGGRLAPLPGSREEATRIRRVAETAGLPTTLLLGARATVPAVEAAAPGARFLHIATHGIAGSSTQPYDASLALTPPELPSVDDIGFLRLEDLLRSWVGRLSGCELVVLSACHSGHGVRVGDTVMSLPWGFLHAGADAVLASQWQVDDSRNAELMGEIYEAVLSGERDVLGTIASAKRRFATIHPHPYYWAPFIYLGDPRRARGSDRGAGE